MKNVIILLFAFLVACSPVVDPKAELIRDYEQRISENVKADLGIEFKNIELVGVVTSTDSANMLVEQIEKLLKLDHVDSVYIREKYPETLAGIRNYQEDTDTLVKKYSAVYTVDNLEVTSIYHFTPDESRIIRKE